jgi:hypothetical protein
MIKRLGLAVFLLACIAAPARANGPFGFNVGLNFGMNFSTCGPCGGCGFGPGGYGCGAGFHPAGPGGAQLAPWYLYWPMDAHFQVPAPMTYPFWPSPMAPLEGAGHSLQPASYQFTPPPYWYGR